MSVDRDRLARIILAGMNDIQEWRLGNPALAAAKGYPREHQAGAIEDWGILFIDITRDAETGDIVCHEVNGPNAVGSDALTGDSMDRARNEAAQALRRAREYGHVDAHGTVISPFATIHAHQHWQFFRTGGEFYPRVAAFADCLGEALPAARVECQAAGDALGDEDVSVVMGDVPAVSSGIEFDPDARRFRFRGRPVVFAGNPNLLPELVRTGKIAPGVRDSGDPVLRIFHAWRLAGMIHDKNRQQDLFEDTGIRALRHFVARDVPEAVANCRELLTFGPVVIKPSDTSGGAGVNVVTAEMDDTAIRARIEDLLSECRAKYGDNADAMVWPIRGFEFVRSTGYPMDDGEHLWDLRIAVLFEPGRAFTYPVSLRLTPEAFDPARFAADRRHWVSNVSGRRETLLRSGMDDAVLASVGMTQTEIDRAMQACVKWTQKAWDLTARGAGRTGSVFEDSRDSAERPFYRSERFVT